MTQPTDKEIKNRAYEIWERNGKPEGKEDEFWQQAEQELRNEDKSSPSALLTTCKTDRKCLPDVSFSSSQNHIALLRSAPLVVGRLSDYLCHRASRSS
jgi:hypothetical protein